MGGMVKGRENTASNLFEMCVPHRTYSFSLLTASISFMTRQLIRFDVLRQYALHVYLYFHPLPRTARSTIPQHQCATHSLSFTSQIHSTATTSSCQWVGTVEARLLCCATASARKRGARHGSAICRRTTEWTRSATPAHENIRVSRK